ncbi:MAG: hybrid sensor histidine kinase/response regulator [Polyangiaceae bacterium]
MKAHDVRVKFLIVDDLPENLLALEALLEDPSVEILKAASGREALEILLDNDVALALVDVQMPEMDGFELAELMRGTERTKHVPIIFVTAGAEERNRLFKGYDAGAVDFLFKPVEPTILKHKVDIFLRLHRKRNEIARTLRLNEELMAIVGHDLRNPLNVILMTASLMGASATDVETKKAVTRLQTSGKRMLQIISDLNDLSRSRLGGGIPIEPRPMDLATVVHKTIAEIELANPTRRIDVHARGDLRGEWDAPRLEQVFSNLVGNAARHGTDGEPIVVTLEGGDDSVVASIHNGGHVPPELIARLFEPFHTGTGPRKRVEGLGLGLYIVDQLVRAHDGDVEVTSCEREGTTFRVTLPRAARPN